MRQAQPFNRRAGCTGVPMVEAVSRWGLASGGLAWIILITTTLGTIIHERVHAQGFGPEGSVKFYVDAKSDFDRWTSDPTEAQICDISLGHCLAGASRLGLEG